jgi:hypothetical protein
MNRVVVTAALLAGSICCWAGSVRAYQCPPRRSPKAKTVVSKGKKLRLQVTKTGVAMLSRLGSGSGQVVWRSIQIGFVPDVVTFHPKGPWVAVFAHRYGVKVIGPKGKIRADYPYGKLLKRWDLRKAGTKCGSWWLVSARPSFRSLGGGRARLFVRFDWGRIVQISLPSGKMARWVRGRKP